MSHFALVRNNLVVDVIVAEQDYIDTLTTQEDSSWIKTSFNTRHGVHTQGGTPLRKNFAGIGYTYDEDLDAFIPPKPYDAWVLDTGICDWVAPVAYPTDGKIYQWDGSTNTWVLSTYQSS